MNFIKESIQGGKGGNAHIQFQKFSKGEFKDRALIKVKKAKDKITINSSSEFANEFVEIMAKKLGENKTKVIGAIISTSDLKNELNFKEVKQFQGVKRYVIDSEMSGKEILNLVQKFPKNFFGLSFSVGENNLKIKPKAPKSGKPGKGDSEGPKADFCKLITNDVEIGKDFIFEKPDFKEAEINHTFVIEKIEIPSELKGSDDFAKIREESLRIGKIIRKSKIDGSEMKKEYDFRA